MNLTVKMSDDFLDESVGSSVVKIKRNEFIDFSLQTMMKQN